MASLRVLLLDIQFKSHLHLRKRNKEIRNDREVVSGNHYGLPENEGDVPGSHTPSVFTELLFQTAENEVLSIINH